MPKTISANEARDWINSASEQDDAAIVEVDGKAKVAIISVSDLEELKALREEKRRAEAIERLQALGEELARQRKPREPLDQQTRDDALRRLHKLREEVSARNSDLTEEQIEEVANRMSRDMIDHMVATGKISFERDQQ